MNQTDDQYDAEEEEEHRFLAACLLARQGKYAEARQKLDEALSRAECSEAQALDVKARMCAQQGLLLEAETCWRKAQSLDASNPAYADALAALRQRQYPRVDRMRASVRAGAAVLLLLLIAAVAMEHRAAKRERLALTQRLTVMEGEIGALREAADQASAATAKALDPLAKTDDVQAVSRQTSDGLRQAVAELQAEMGRQAEASKARQAALDATLKQMQESLTALQPVPVPQSTQEKSGGRNKAHWWKRPR